jgi:hypothetical protein
MNQSDAGGHSNYTLEASYPLKSTGWNFLMSKQSTMDGKGEFVALVDNNSNVEYEVRKFNYTSKKASSSFCKIPVTAFSRFLINNVSDNYVFSSNDGHYVDFNIPDTAVVKSWTNPFPFISSNDPAKIHLTNGNYVLAGSIMNQLHLQLLDANGNEIIK